MTLRLLALAASMALGGMLEPRSAAAQQAAAMDTAAVLSEVARELEAEGSDELAEALLRHIVQRYPDSTTAADVRERLEVLIADQTDSSGAVELYVWSTLYGLWLGVVVPGSLGATGPEPFGVGLLVGGPAGFFTAQSILRDRPISVGQARAITWGGTWGSWQGYGWGTVLDLTKQTRQYSYQSCFEFDPQTLECTRAETVTYESDEYDSQQVFASLLVGGALGLVAGSTIASRGEISPGTATLVNFGSLWGSWYGLASSFITNQDEHDDRVLLWTLIGGNIGLLTTALIAPGEDITRTRARLINVAGVAGLLGGFGIDLLIQPDDEAVAFGIPLVTSAVGLALGAMTTGDDERVADRGIADEVVENALFQVTGGRIGMGIPMPVPILLPAGRSSSSLEPALKFTLVQARF